MLGVGVAEDAAAALLGELLHRGPCELRAAVVVDAVGVARAECVERDTLDLVPVDLYAGHQHKIIVIEDAAAKGLDAVLCGVYERYRVLDPLDIVGHALILRFPYVVGAVYTSGNKGESWLVVLTVAGVDDGYVGVLEQALEACCHAYTRCAAADDDYASAGVALGGVCLVGAEHDEGAGYGHQLKKLGTRDDAVTLHAFKLFLEVEF